MAAPKALPPGIAISPSSAAKTCSDCENLLMPPSLQMVERPGSVSVRDYQNFVRGWGAIFSGMCP